MANDDSTKTPALADAGPEMPVNPYGGGPSKGLQFPPYYKPTPSAQPQQLFPRQRGPRSG